MKDTLIDVAIIGASLSGCLLALLLAREGITVALIDKEPLGRSKPCGEGMSALGMNFLEGLKLFESEELQAIRMPIFGYRFNAVKQKLCSRTPLVFGVERSKLQMLLEKKIAGDSHIYSFSEKPLTVSVNEEKCLTHLSSHRITSSYIVAADSAGCRALLPHRQVNYSQKEKRFGVRFHVEVKDTENMVDIYTYQEGENDIHVLLTPVSRLCYNISVLMPCLGSGLTIARECAHKACIEKWGVVPKQVTALEGRVVTAHKVTMTSDRCFAVGDASEQLDPRGGMGMTHSIISAYRVSRHLQQKIHSIPSTAANSLSEPCFEAQSHYLRGMTALSLIAFSRFGTTRLGTFLATSPLSSAIMQRLVDHTLPSGLTITAITTNFLRYAISILGRLSIIRLYQRGEVHSHNPHSHNVEKLIV